MNINFKITKEELKEKIAKGIILLTLTGTLVSNGPVKSSKGATIEVRTSTEVDTDDESIGTLKLSNDKNVTSASASVTATSDIETVRKDALKELKNVYKTYNKKYYKAKSYTKLTKYYKTAVSKVKKAKTVNDIDVICEKYETLMNNIKPSLLVKYQKKMETKFLKSYKSLLSKNTYSDINLEKIEEIKNEGIEKIYAAKTKTQSKKVKNTYTNNLKAIKTTLEETKIAAYEFINSIKDLNQTEKNKLIEKVDNMINENDIVVLMEENGYDPKGTIDDYVETNPNKMTKDILNDEDKLNEFIDKRMNELEEKWLDHFKTDKDTYPLTDCDLKLMIYLLNYNYIDPSISKKAFVDTKNIYVNILGEVSFDDMVESLYAADGIIRFAIYYGETIDYDLFIIENNDTKGIGKAINNFQKYILEKNDEKIDKFISNYIEKYGSKNYIVDSVILDATNYFNCKYTDNLKKLSQLNSAYYASEIRNDYFLSALERDKIYKK